MRNLCTQFYCNPFSGFGERDGQSSSGIWLLYRYCIQKIIPVCYILMYFVSTKSQISSFKTEQSLRLTLFLVRGWGEDMKSCQLNPKYCQISRNSKGPRGLRYNVIAAPKIKAKPTLNIRLYRQFVRVSKYPDYISHLYKSLSFSVILFRFNVYGRTFPSLVLKIPKIR